MTTFNEPIPADGRLVRAVRRQLEHTQHAKLLAQIARDTGGDIQTERDTARKRHTVDPGDARTLRGIPAIGLGVAGHIPGTRPDSICDKD